MPVTPRIAITVPAASYDTLRYLSLTSGRSMSSIVAELVETVQPVLQRTAEILAAGKRAEMDRAEGLKEAVQGALERMEEHAARAALHLGFGVEEIGALTGVDARSAPPRQGAGPPASNTGVRSPRQSAKNQRNKLTRKGKKA